MTEQPRTDRKPPRRWLQFSLRAVVLFTVLVSIALGWIGNILVRVRRQRAAIARVEAMGGQAVYDYHASRVKSPPGPEFVRTLVGDDAFASVESIRFSYRKKFTGDDLAVLAEFPKLKRLDLSFADVDDEGIARIGTLRTLEFLYLRGINISDSNIVLLLNLHELRFLNIEQTDVTDRGLEHLRSLKQLNRVVVGPAISKDAAQRLKQSLPDGFVEGRDTSGRMTFILDE
ncbi:MAG: hypothetical protein MUF06_12060 [Pirellulaceae bacterium]|jgi:hypothetical protein|nr:hypothetical protein [Pirellulaceae bacterium]